MQQPTSSSATEPTKQPPEPIIMQRRLPSLVWLLPLLTLIIGGWLIIKTLVDQGPEITISFKNVEGIEAGKTKIKYKDLEVGIVDGISFSKDFSKVILTASLSADVKGFLRRDSRFWVVKPRLSLRGVSGLDTLVSGAYIELEPGQGASWRKFIGLDAPPVIKANVEGSRFTLITKKLGSIDASSPIYYQGILVGEVLGYELTNDNKNIFIHAFIKAPFNELVRGNSQFWNVSGIDMAVSSEGINVSTESLLSIMFGGISFDTPTSLDSSASDVDGLVFTLYASHHEIKQKSFVEKVVFIAFFEGSIRGLEIGAPVELQGIKIGHVADIRLEFDPRDTSFHLPVLLEIEPQRVISRDKSIASSPVKIVEILKERGLRAQLKTGSLLTGQLFVDFVMRPDTELRLLSNDQRYPELPTIPGNLAQMAISVKHILAKLEKVEIEKIFSDLQDILQGTNHLVNSPELQGSISELNESVRLFKQVLGKLDPKMDSISNNLDQAINSGNLALEKSHQTLGLLNKLLKPNSPMQYRMNRMMSEMSETARSIRTLVDLLERNPDAIIYGKTGGLP